MRSSICGPVVEGGHGRQDHRPHLGSAVAPEVPRCSGLAHHEDQRPALLERDVRRSHKAIRLVRAAADDATRDDDHPSVLKSRRPAQRRYPCRWRAASRDTRLSRSPRRWCAWRPRRRRGGLDLAAAQAVEDRCRNGAGSSADTDDDTSLAGTCGGTPVASVVEPLPLGAPSGAGRVGGRRPANLLVDGLRELRLVLQHAEDLGAEMAARIFSPDDPPSVVDSSATMRSTSAKSRSRPMRITALTPAPWRLPLRVSRRLQSEAESGSHWHGPS